MPLRGEGIRAQGGDVNAHALIGQRGEPLHGTQEHLLSAVVVAAQDVIVRHADLQDGAVEVADGARLRHPRLFEGLVALVVGAAI